MVNILSKDYFEQKAESYDKDANRVGNVDNIANFILKNFAFITICIYWI